MKKPQSERAKLIRSKRAEREQAELRCPVHNVILAPRRGMHTIRVYKCGCLVKP